ncbi:MAG: polysaccharide deacetylase family protein [Bacteroidota bacterium]|nr:polysaccharide deacetylase family protein [Bacteroidota bacterium]
MKLNQAILFVITVLIFQQSYAQKAKEWNGKQCAVVLTYDDALNVHLDNVIPCLDSAGIKGTFYIVGESPALNKRIAEWRLAAKHGHELGNHTLTHPCDACKPGRSWVTPEKDLSKYSVDRAIKEIRVNNTLLKAIDGKTERTFAFPCGDTKIDTVNFYDAVKHEFAGARGVKSDLKSLNQVDLNDINCYGMNGQSGDYMIDLVNKAMKSHTLLVFLFHGVGGEHSINVSREAHSQLIHYLKQHKNEIWVAPMVEVAKYIKKNQSHKK